MERYQLNTPFAASVFWGGLLNVNCYTGMKDPVIVPLYRHRYGAYF